MGNRTWLAVALCCLVWFGYMRWFAPPPLVAPTEAGAPAAALSTPAKSTLTQGDGVPSSAGISGSPFSIKPAAPGASALELKNVVQETVLAASGAKIASVRLLDFNQTLKKDSPKIESVDPVRMPHAFGTLFTEGSLADFSVGVYAQKRAGGKVVFEKTHSGVSVTKSFSLEGNSYFVDEEIQISFPPGERKDWGYLYVPVGGRELTEQVEDPLQAWEAVAFQNDSVSRKTLGSIKQGSEVVQGDTKWVSFGNRYFSNVVINESTINPDVVFEKNGDFAGVYFRFPLLVKADSRSLQFKLKNYSGPKEYSELGKVPGLKGLIDYGMFSVLAYPLLELLRFFNRFVHNYGLAIILLTLLVRILFYPLSLKSYQSMKAMQKLQPQINALKEKYKDDAQKFGQEQMALFRAHKVNPAGGCLPVLVQMPVFFALYAVLQNSIELFHAPFFLWVQDLSSKDPYYVFPALMGISMFLQQKMTPAVGMDPAQQKILLFMPLIFSFVTISLPAGLTMYIFVSTLLGILQQVLMNREQKPKGPLIAAAQPSRGK